jgi:hypothetical protein
MTEFFKVCFILLSVYVGVFYVIPYILFKLITAIFPSLAEPATVVESDERPLITDDEWNRMKVVAHMNNGSYWRDNVDTSNPNSMTLWGLDQQYIDNYRIRNGL